MMNKTVKRSERNCGQYVNRDVGLLRNVSISVDSTSQTPAIDFLPFSSLDNMWLWNGFRVKECREKVIFS